MQEIKFLMLLVGTAANMDEYVFDGPMADAHVQGYLNQGFKVHSVHPGSVDQSKNAISVVFILLRDGEPQVEMDVSKAQDQFNQVVAQEQINAAGIKRQSTDASMWKTSEEKAMATKLPA